MLKEHAIASAKLITAMKPDYLGFLTLLLEPGAPMLKEVKSGAMQLLTPAQVLDCLKYIAGTTPPTNTAGK